MAVSEIAEERFEADDVFRRHLESREHAAEVGAVVPVVEQADVPASAQLVEEFHQRPWTFGKLEAAEIFVLDGAAASPDHVPHVQLGDLIAGEIDRSIAGPFEAGRQRSGVLARARGNADKDVGAVAAAQPVIELGHDATPNRLAELAKCARALRDRDTENRLACLAELRAFRDEAEP